MIAEILLLLPKVYIKPQKSIISDLSNKNMTISFSDVFHTLRFKF